MSDPILEARTIEFEVRGVPMKMHRRSTLIAAKARSFKHVLGLIGGENAVADGKVKLDDVPDDKILDMMTSTLRAAMIMPVVVGPGEESDPPNSYTYEEFAPFADAAFDKYMNSGLSAAPMPGSCVEQKEQKPQEPCTS